MKKTILVLIAAASIVASCKKSKDTVVTPTPVNYGTQFHTAFPGISRDTLVDDGHTAQQLAVVIASDGKITVINSIIPTGTPTGTVFQLVIDTVVGKIHGAAGDEYVLEVHAISPDTLMGHASLFHGNNDTYQFKSQAACIPAGDYIKN